jgi:hypothetical protein
MNPKPASSSRFPRELLHELVPAAVSIGLLINPAKSATADRG